MKILNRESKVLRILIAFHFVFFLNSLKAQQFLTRIDGWNAYVHLPSDYANSPSKKYPLILFLPGIGEVGTDPSKLMVNGPAIFIAQGDSMVYNVNGEIIRPIVISIQPASAWPTPSVLNQKIDSIERRWRIDTSCLNVTGLSMGGWAWQNYSDGYEPVFTNRVTSMVVMSAPEPDNSISNMKMYALAGGKWWGFEGDNDYRKMDLVRDAMNKYVPSSARYYKYIGGHCCWNTWYNPSWHDADGESIYTWMLKQKKGGEKINVSPKANAGADKSITLPINSLSLSGSGQDADGTITGYSWAKVSGPNAGKIATPNNALTNINDLIGGIYKYELTVTDDNGAKAKDTVQVTVYNPVDAGKDTTVLLPAQIIFLKGFAAPVDGTLPVFSWTKISGPIAGKIDDPSSETAKVTDLAPGLYRFQLTATEENGTVSKDTVSVRVAEAAESAKTADASCGCDFTLPKMADGGIYFTNGNSGMNITPGKKVCITAGTYPYISITGLVGTASQPITIINCGGQVVCGGSGPYCLRIVNSQYFHLTGTGASDVTYGFKANWSGGFTGAGVSAKDSTSDWEIDHVETQNVQNGFLCKIDPYNCAPGTYSTGWIMKNISIHDCYVHNTVGEGLYVINTAQTVDVLDCSGKTITVEPVKGDVVKIYNNIVDSTGWDGIQVAASRHAQIYNNRITHYGIANMGSQQAGLILGGKSSGAVYNNYINGGTGEGMEIFGYGVDGPIKIYNNVLIHCGFDGTSTGQNAINIDDRPQPGTTYSGLQVYVINNTVVDAARNAMTINDSYGTMAAGNKIYNNLLVKPNNTSPYDNPYTSIGGKLNVDTLNNIKIPVIANAKFVNTGTNDYHILSTSPAVNAGLNASSYGVTSDLDGLARPQGTAYDAGAYEYKSGGTNQAPTARAGNDVTITLPTNSVTLSGSGTDADGTISSYAWVKISGTGGTITSPSSATTTVTGLAQGTYKFQLTVTDNGGATGKDTVQVTVNTAVNQSPTARAGSDITITLPTNSVTLSGSGTDADGTIGSYAWSKISGTGGTITSPSSASTTVTGLAQGTYKFQLTVTDNSGATGKDTVQVTVNAAATNKAPTAYAGTDITITLPINLVTLSGSGTDADGTISSYAWTKISGTGGTITSPTLAITTVTGLTQGAYKYQLTVTDNKGATGKDTVQVTVKAAALIRGPIVNAGSDVSITKPVSTASLNGSATDQSGTITSYSWKKIAGPIFYKIADKSKAQTTVSNLRAGNYKFELTATDNNGAVDKDTVQITVNSASKIVKNLFSFESNAIDNSALSEKYSLLNRPDVNNNSLSDIEKNNLKVFPNPVRDDLTLDIKQADRNEKLIVTIVNMSGNIIYRQVINRAQNNLLAPYKINISSLQQGSYIVNVKFADSNQQLSAKIIKIN